MQSVLPMGLWVGHMVVRNTGEGEGGLLEVGVILVQELWWRQL